MQKRYMPLYLCIFMHPETNNRVDIFSASFLPIPLPTQALFPDSVMHNWLKNSKMLDSHKERKNINQNMVSFLLMQLPLLGQDGLEPLSVLLGWAWGWPIHEATWNVSMEPHSWVPLLVWLPPSLAHHSSGVLIWLVESSVSLLLPPALLKEVGGENNFQLLPLPAWCIWCTK